MTSFTMLSQLKCNERQLHYYQFDREIRVKNVHRRNANYVNKISI